MISWMSVYNYQCTVKNRVFTNEGEPLTGDNDVE